MMNDKIKALEREVELLQKVIELTKQLEELKAKHPAQPVIVPYVPVPTYPPYPWDPYHPTVIYTDTTTAWNDNVALYQDGEMVN